VDRSLQAFARRIQEPAQRRQFEQLKSVYRSMANKADHRPTQYKFLDCLPTIEEEAVFYAALWWHEEDRGDFHIGCCDFQTRAATIFAIEAARLLTRGVSGRAQACILLRLALGEAGGSK